MENGEHDKENMREQCENVEVDMDDDLEEDDMSDDVLSEKEAMDTRPVEADNTTQYTPQFSDCSAQYRQEEESDPDDHYRPEGRLELEIDKFSEFARGPADLQQRLSKPIFVRGLPWRILAIPRDQQRCSGTRTNKALGFFLQCNGDAEMMAWNCIATATLTVKSQTGGEDYFRRISHTFYPKENDWGYSQFMSCDQLMSPENGYYADDTIKLQVIVSADAPHGVHWDSKKHAGYIGLKNQGATCYMNSLLQTFFFTNQLRKAVYEMPTQGEEAESSVALAMQRVFYDLQYSDKPVGTKKLTKSFGWDSLDSFLQHDVQELCRVLLENLENKMKGTKVEGTIPKLFRGKSKSYIRCIDVDFESSHEDYFYDVQLNVKGNGNIIQSFRDYVASERLDGDNKYDAGEYGLQPAEKGVKFLTFPPILHLQLMRFQYDPNLDANVKINDRCDFPERLCLNDFVEDRKDGEDYTYCLHAVLVHAGDFHGGHYVVFINTKLNSPTSCWCKFDDDVVSRCSFRDAVSANYGGEDTETPGRVFTNAYMLVYIRESKTSEVLCSISDDDIPRHLRERFEAEKTDEMNRKKEKMEAHLFTEIVLIKEERFMNHHGFDLFDLRVLDEDVNREKVKKKMTFDELYAFVGEKLFGTQGSRTDFRLWMFNDSPVREEGSPVAALSRLRPTTLLARGQPKHIDELLDSDRNLIFVELPHLRIPLERLMPYDDKNDIMMFIKLYSPQQRTVIFLGHLMMNFRDPVGKYANKICEMAKFPADTPLHFYEEIAPDRVRMISDHRVAMSTEGVLLEISDGGILIVEKEIDAKENNCIQAYADELYNKIEVEAVCNSDSNQFVFTQQEEVPPINGHIYLTWDMRQLTSWIGEQTKFDPEKILLWKMNAYNEKPTSYLTEHQQTTFKVRDLLSLVGPSMHDPRRQKRYRLNYTRMPVPVRELDKRRQIKVQMMDDKMNITEVTLFPLRTGTVESLLDEAKREFKFAPDGTGILRLVFVGLTPNCTRVLQVFDSSTKIAELVQKIITPNAYMARVEEVPVDQVTIGTNEHLLPVAHFDKEPTRMFGTPFLLKVMDREPLSDVQKRIRDLLDINEKEYEKYKFAIISQGRVVRYLDMLASMTVNLAELRHSQVTANTSSYPLLGIDHLNKSRGARSGNTTEKAIVIHN